MKLGVFVSDFTRSEDILGRLKAEKLGIFLVSNGVYHAVVKEKGKASPLLDKKEAKFYVLSEDLQTRGFANEEADKRASVINYSGLIDLIIGEYEKLAWL